MSNTKLPHIQQFNIQSMNNDIQFKTTKSENKLWLKVFGCLEIFLRQVKKSLYYRKINLQEPPFR